MKQKHYFVGKYKTATGEVANYRLRILSTITGNVSPYYYCELIRSEHETPHDEIVNQAYIDDLPWTHEVVFFGELVAGIPKAQLVSRDGERDTWEFHPPHIVDFTMFEERLPPLQEMIPVPALTLADIDAFMDKMIEESGRV